MLDKIKKFISDRETYYPNIEIFLYFLIKAIKKTFIGIGLIKPDKNNKDMFDWPLYYLHYKGEIKREAKTHTISLAKGDYTFTNGRLVKSNPSIKPLHPHHRFLYETIMRLNPKSIFEMGCGTGMHLHNISTLLPQVRICGTDLLDIQLEYLTNIYPDLKNNVKQADATVITKEPPFKICDLAFTQAVLMHIHTEDSHLKALENLFAMSNRYVVLFESTKNHPFLDDIRKLHSLKKIKWENIYFYYQLNPENKLPSSIICSSVKLPYLELTDYNIFLPHTNSVLKHKQPPQNMIIGLLKRTKKIWTDKIQQAQNFRNNLKFIKFYKKYIGLNRLVFDVGAHVGSKTDLFLKLGCKVIAIEPQSDLAAYLRVKYFNNQSVIVEQCGLSENEGEATIHISTKYPGFSSFNKSWQISTKYHSFDKTETVKVTTLEKLIEKYGVPDFCKIDVEGHEPQILSGLKTKIPTLNFEFHSNDPELVEACLKKLETLGFTKFNFATYEDAEMALPEWQPATNIFSEIKNIEQKSGQFVWGDVYAR